MQPLLHIGLIVPFGPYALEVIVDRQFFNGNSHQSLRSSRMCNIRIGIVYGPMGLLETTMSWMLEMKQTGRLSDVLRDEPQMDLPIIRIPNKDRSKHELIVEYFLEFKLKSSSLNASNNWIQRKLHTFMNSRRVEECIFVKDGLKHRQILAKKTQKRNPSRIFFRNDGGDLEFA